METSVVVMVIRFAIIVYGHMVDSCCKKHGFQPHFMFTKQNPNIFFVNVTFCNDESDTRQQEFEPFKGNQGQQQFGFTKEHNQSLITLLQQSQVSNNSHVSKQVAIASNSFGSATHIGKILPSSNT